MRKITESGFAFEVEEGKLDDMRLLDMLAELMDDEVPEFQKAVTLSKLFTWILGTEQKNALYKKIAEENDGRVPVEKAAAALGEIMTASDAGNS